MSILTAFKHTKTIYIDSTIYFIWYEDSMSKLYNVNVHPFWWVIQNCLYCLKRVFGSYQNDLSPAQQPQGMHTTTHTTQQCNLYFTSYACICIWVWVWVVGGLVFWKVFQKLAPDIWIKYLGYITNIPEVTMDFEHV